MAIDRVSQHHLDPVGAAAAEKVSSQESRTRGWAACALAGYHSWCWCIFIATSQKGQKDAENTWKYLGYQMGNSNSSSDCSLDTLEAYKKYRGKHHPQSHLGNIIPFRRPFGSTSWAMDDNARLNPVPYWGMVINPFSWGFTYHEWYPFWEGSPMMTWD